MCSDHVIKEASDSRYKTIALASATVTKANDHQEYSLETKQSINSRVEERAISNRHYTVKQLRVYSHH